MSGVPNWEMKGAVGHDFYLHWNTLLYLTGMLWGSPRQHLQSRHHYKMVSFFVIQNNVFHDEIFIHTCYHVLVTLILPCFSSPGPCYHPSSFLYCLFHFHVHLRFEEFAFDFIQQLYCFFDSNFLLIFINASTSLSFFNGQNLYKHKIIIGK